MNACARMPVNMAITGHASLHPHPLMQRPARFMPGVALVQRTGEARARVLLVKPLVPASSGQPALRAHQEVVLPAGDSPLRGAV